MAQGNDNEQVSPTTPTEAPTADETPNSISTEEDVVTAPTGDEADTAATNEENGADETPAPEPRKPRYEIVTTPTRTLTVAVTGATGFVGQAICHRLAEKGHRVRTLVRRGAAPVKRARLPKSAQVVEGDLFDQSALDQLVDKADAVMHLVGIIMEDPRRGITFEHIHVEGTQNVVNAAQAAGVLRYVHMSALGSRPGAPATYHATKGQAEQIVRASRLPYTIFKPSLIHGPSGEFTRMVANWVRGKAPPFLFMPYFGSGFTGHGPLSHIQPVYIDDLAEIFCRALDNDHTIRETFNVGGGSQLTWPEMLTTFRDAIAPGSKKKARAIPAWYAMRVAMVARFLSLGKLVPFNVDQVIMSQEDSTCELDRILDHFGIEPMPFTDALAKYASNL